MRLLRSGPCASLLELDAPPSPETSARLAQLRARLAATAPPEVRDLVPGFASLLIEHRATLTPRALHAWMRRAAAATSTPTPPRRRTIDVVYGEDADVAELEAALGMPFGEIVRRHQEHEATVAFVGFTPGFPYLLGLPDALHLPRQDTPRTRVPAGAVAIAAGRGGIYPSASPGGWWVLGRTEARLFAPYREPPAWLLPGDRVTFRAVEAHPAAPGGSGGAAAHVSPSDLAPSDLAPSDLAPSASAPSDSELSRPALSGPALEVLDAVPGSASLQATTRPGGGHLGLSEAGALDPVARDAANRMVGNAAGAALLETIGQPIALRSEVEVLAAVAGGGTAVAIDGRSQPTWRAFVWPAGATLELVPDSSVPGRTALIAVAGALGAELWRGSRSTDVRAGAGGSRRWLAPGDRVPLAGEPTGAPLAHPGRPRHPSRLLLRLHAGPQYDPASFDALARTAFRLADADRTGARLDGPPVPHRSPSILSDGSPLGAVQVPPDGRPIVLLADRGRTGGYAKPAVVDARDLWRLAQARPGDEIWLLDARSEDPRRPDAELAEPLDFGA